MEVEGLPNKAQKLLIIVNVYCLNFIKQNSLPNTGNPSFELKSANGRETDTLFFSSYNQPHIIKAEIIKKLNK